MITSVIIKLDNGVILKLKKNNEGFSFTEERPLENLPSRTAELKKEFVETELWEFLRKEL